MVFMQYAWMQMSQHPSYCGAQREPSLLSATRHLRFVSGAPAPLASWHVLSLMQAHSSLSLSPCFLNA